MYSSLFLTRLLGLSSAAHADPLSLVGDLLIGAYQGNKIRVENNSQMNLKKSLFGSDAECLSPVGSVRIHEPENDHWTFYKLPAPTNILQSPTALRWSIEELDLVHYNMNVH